MFKAYATKQHGAVQRIQTFAELDEVWKDPHTRLWIDIEKPSAEILHELDDIVDVDDTSLEACLANEEARPRVDEFPDHIFLLLYGVLSPEEDPDFAPRKLAAFCGRRYLVTIHDDRHRTIDNMHSRFLGNGHHLLSRGVDFLLYSIIDGMVDNYGIALADFDKQLEDLEEASLDRADDGVFLRATHLRRELLELRRLAFAQREALGALARGECDYVAASLGQRFTHVTHHLTKTIELSDSLREILNSVRENYQFAETRRTNEIVRALTVFASVLLPMSLIAGIYGMNLKTWPSLDHPEGFWWVLGGMATIATAMFLIFRSRRWW